jgi:polygalacturonase
VTITHCYFRTGDDNIAIKGGPGGATNMTVIHNHFYWGHGMSIGSQTDGGVSKIRVSDLTLDGTDSGIRIKSAGDRGGLVNDVVYDDVCIRNSNRPVDITASYADNNAGRGSAPPVFRGIVLRDIDIAGGGEVRFDGYDDDHRAQITVDGVFLRDRPIGGRQYSYELKHADVEIGPKGTNLSMPSGEDVKSRGMKKMAPDHMPSCSDRFVPFPE